MNNLKKFIFTTIIFSLLSISAYANNSIDDGNLFDNDVVSEANNSDIEPDYSDLTVKVTKITDSITEVIYTGPLGGYDNGSWVNVDLSKFQFILVFDWDSEGSVIIAPVENETLVSSNLIEKTAPYLMHNAVFNTLNNDKIKVNLNMVYGNSYYEGILLNGQSLSIPIGVINTGNDSVEMIGYMAEYDSAGRLIDLTQSALITVPPEQAIDAVAVKEINENTHTAKIFLWENNTLKPIIQYIDLQAQNIDYYADTMENAQCFDITKKINGKIDYSGDVDFIKFIPKQTGDYIIREQSSSALDCKLYNSSGSIIAEAASLGNDKYIKCQLSADEDYYVKVNGNAISEYVLTIKQAENTASISAVNDGILYTGNIAGNNTEISLYSSGGELIDRKTVAQGNNINCILNDDSLETEYVIKTETEDGIADVYKIHLIKNETSYSVDARDYISVPIVVKNIKTLKNTSFSVLYDPLKLNIADISDLTKAVEVGTGVVSGAQVNTFYVNNGSVNFKSTRNISSAWSGLVNSVKLQTNTNGTVDITTVICIPE